MEKNANPHSYKKIQIETRMTCPHPSPPPDWRYQIAYGEKGAVDKNVNWSNLSGGQSGSIYQDIIERACGRP